MGRHCHSQYEHKQEEETVDENKQLYEPFTQTENLKIEENKTRIPEIITESIENTNTDKKEAKEEVKTNLKEDTNAEANLDSNQTNNSNSELPYKVKTYYVSEMQANIQTNKTTQINETDTKQMQIKIQTASDAFHRNIKKFKITAPDTTKITKRYAILSNERVIEPVVHKHMESKRNAVNQSLCCDAYRQDQKESKNHIVFNNSIAKQKTKAHDLSNLGSELFSPRIEEPVKEQYAPIHKHHISLLKRNVNQSKGDKFELDWD